MKVYFNYFDVDDDIEFEYNNLSFSQIKDRIKDHNEYFETNYQTIKQFNDNEEFYKIEIHIEI